MSGDDLFDEYATVRWEDAAPNVVRLWLDRPDRMNAYDSQMCADLRAAIDRFDRDDTVRVLVLTGAGRGFCAGGDIGGDDPRLAAELAGQLGRAQNLKHDLHAVVRDLLALDKPVIAAVNGAAVAGGLTLALTADLRVAGESAKLGDTSSRVGLLPDEGGAWLFPRVMGHGAAYRMVALGEVYGAARARELGLVDEVVPDGELAQVALDLASAFAARSPLALRVAKRLLRDGATSTLEQSFSDAALAVMFVNTSEDAQEGLRAFREKRAPDFTGH
ncbi:enoyl-CoA hydratase/isomerase family protein [Frankia sp. AvcI1]|uniref:enoyl-CoA hydratase/isomerase family protein n=1 Tax=Frankia sp. AvcI1 TaxID=573496 RepID=UPI0006EC1B5B|nr:enoyl-CoA hydratase-related protein [Frankia sp. AvcI1]